MCATAARKDNFPGIRRVNNASNVFLLLDFAVVSIVFNIGYMCVFVAACQSFVVFVPPDSRYVRMGDVFVVVLVVVLLFVSPIQLRSIFRSVSPSSIR